MDIGVLKLTPPCLSCNTLYTMPPSCAREFLGKSNAGVSNGPPHCQDSRSRPSSKRRPTAAREVRRPLTVYTRVDILLPWLISPSSGSVRRWTPFVRFRLMPAGLRAISCDGSKAALRPTITKRFRRLARAYSRFGSTLGRNPESYIWLSWMRQYTSCTRSRSGVARRVKLIWRSRENDSLKFRPCAEKARSDEK